MTATAARGHGRHIDSGTLRHPGSPSIAPQSAHVHQALELTLDHPPKGDPITMTLPPTSPTPALDTAVADIAPIRHREAMDITTVENQRLRKVLDGLSASQWASPTDCTRWDVRAVVVHLIGSADGQASPLEFARQVLAGRKLIEQIGGDHWVDGLNEAQLNTRRDLTVEELPERWTTAAASALRARRAMPSPVRRLPLLPLGEAMGTRLGWKPLGYLFDMGFTRDVWMHRIDLTRAVGTSPHLTVDHDGRIVADIVAEWSTVHEEPFTLHLQGPAGGRYTARGGADPITLDAVEFCRVLSGRAKGTGVLCHALPL